jgi:hypothetical protein
MTSRVRRRTREHIDAPTGMAITDNVAVCGADEAVHVDSYTGNRLALPSLMQILISLCPPLATKRTSMAPAGVCTCGILNVGHAPRAVAMRARPAASPVVRSSFLGAESSGRPAGTLLQCRALKMPSQRRRVVTSMAAKGRAAPIKMLHCFGNRLVIKLLHIRTWVLLIRELIMLDPMGSVNYESVRNTEDEQLYNGFFAPGL